MSLAVFHRLLRHSAAPFALALCLFAPVVSHAEGGAGVSGGDDCEQRFKEVANDVRKWVEGGGPKFLDHKKCGSTVEEYTRKMKAATSGFKVQCVSKKDPPDKNGKPVWPVQVNGSPKLCINWEENGTRQFRCDYSKFYKDRPTPDERFRSVSPRAPTEFAAIAGLEPASDNDSNYCYSDQLEGFLENKSSADRPRKKTRTSISSSRALKRARPPLAANTLSRTALKRSRP